MEQEVNTGKDKLNQKCHKLQDQLAQGRQEVRKEIADFSVQGAAFTKNLQAVITKGEKVLRAAELCNKLQNQQKVLPLSSEGDTHLRNRAEQEVCESAEMQELQKHLNSALLHREALRNHIEDLRQENQQLQVLVDRLDDSLEGHLAPLPVLQVQITSVPPAADRRHTVIEAAHIVKYCLLDS
ncbi:hypothetical protein CHARACLAT_031528 [Characodon lateralis]|uniref:Uncharacterized protein n=1 Tax=Characodon lateralis TaxID=208331 RepID=A0ABU7EP07_9TELE|nr:hypothetical protein [Characodon lateralis]